MRALLAVLLASLAWSEANAGVNEWTPAGPSGGYVSTILVDPADPDRVLAGHLHGVVRSANGGATWTDLRVPTPCSEARAIPAIAPGDAGVIYVTTACGFFRTTDGGAHWTSGTVPGTVRLGRPTVDPLDPDVVWAPVQGDDPGVFVSRDAGDTWSPVGPSDVDVVAIAIAPTVPRRILAAAGAAGVLVSADDGLTWELAGGLPGGSYGSVAFDPSDPSIAYTAGRLPDTGDSAFIQQSANGGATFGPGNVRASSVVTVASIPSAVYGIDEDELRRSTDRGETWDSARPDLPYPSWRYISSLAVSAANPEVLYLGVFELGVLRGSWDGPFGPIGMGFGRASVSDVAASFHRPGHVFVSSSYGPSWRTTDGGESWESISEVSLDVGRLVIGGDPPLVFGAWSRSRDGGDTWEEFFGSIPSAIDGIDPTLAYLISWGERLLYRSTTGGDEWEPLGFTLPRETNPEFVDRLVTHPTTRGLVYALAGYDIYRSIDAGTTWTRVLGAGEFEAFAADPHDPDRLYATNTFEVATSADAGAHWTRTSIGRGSFSRSPYHLLVDPNDPNRLWVGTGDEIWTTRDRGAHWYRVDRGLADVRRPVDWGGVGIVALAADGLTPGRVIAGLIEDGVLVYEDRCGNGVADAFESCDDGNVEPGDGCRTDCTNERAGDGIVDPSEECDDGNFVDGDGCDRNQTRTGCGNGIVTAPEICDDGNEDPSDGCSNCMRSCTADAQCDDGDACTVDVCQAGGCVSSEATALPRRVSCLAHGLEDVCVDESLPPRFAARLAGIRARLEALAIEGGEIEQRKALRMLRRTRHQAGRLPGVGPACARAVRAQLRSVRRRVANAWHS